MAYYKDIDDHMRRKFELNDSMTKLDYIPTNLDEMQDNIFYKIRLTCIAVDVVNFKKMSQHTDAKVLNAIMSEFTYGVTKIMKEYNVKNIDIQGDGIFGIFNANTKDDISKTFSCLCALNTFQNHIQARIKKQLNGKLKIDYYSWGNTEFKFGIGAWFSFDNFISKVGHGSTRDLIFMGESVNKANVLSSFANRNGVNPIAMNDLFYTNLNENDTKQIAEIGGFTKSYLSEINEYVWMCSWILTNYNNFVDNNI